MTEIYKDPKTGKIYKDGKLVYDPDEANWDDESPNPKKNGERDE